MYQYYRNFIQQQNIVKYCTNTSIGFWQGKRCQSYEKLWTMFEAVLCPTQSGLPMVAEWGVGYASEC